MSKKSSDKFQMQHIFRPLKRASKWPIWADVIARLSVAFFLIGIVVLVHWIDRAGLKDSHDGHISFLDVVYFTMISITTTGFGDIAPISRNGVMTQACPASQYASSASSIRSSQRSGELQLISEIVAGVASIAARPPR